MAITLKGRGRAHTCLLVLLLWTGCLFGQATAPKPLPSNVQELRLDSKLMARRVPYRVVLPGDYSDAKAASTRYGVIYLLHGLTGRFDNWVDRTKVAENMAARADLSS